MKRARGRAVGTRAVAASLALLAGCAASPLDEELPRIAQEGVVVRYRPEIDGAVVQAAARAFALVRAEVAKELRLAPDDPPPIAEVVLYRDASWGQERFLVTHAKILEGPLRVQIPCALGPDETDGEEVAARLRGTVAHELAEATVLTRVRILDPYLRWMHDGIAESVAFAVVGRLDPKAASQTIAHYADYLAEADRRQWAWIDLTRWRQLADSIVHSDAFFRDGPIRLNDFKGSLERLADKRLARDPAPGEPETAPETAERLGLFRDLAELLGENEVKTNMPLALPVEGSASPEADLAKREGQFLAYDASFCFWIELERAHPGATAKVLAAVAARRAPVLRSADVVAIVEQATGEKDLSVRLERFTLSRIRRVLEAERRRKG